MFDLTPITTDERFRFAFTQGQSDTLVLSCAGVGTKRGQMPPFEFIKAASGNGAHSVLFVSDKTRSWLSAPGLQAEIVEQMEMLMKRLAPKRVVAMGNSMGGFMALNLSRVLPIDVSIAFTPQYSVDKTIVPEETRWRFFRDQIVKFTVPKVENLPQEYGQHYVFHGGEQDEYIHWSKFPIQKNLRHYIFPANDHNIAKTLKEHNLLAPIIDACISNHPRKVRELTKQAGGEWRNEKAYQRCMELHRYEETGETT